MSKGLILRVVLHGAVCIGYPFLVGWLFFIFQYMGGERDSRGVAAGLAVQLVCYFVAGSNLLMVAISNVRFRIGVMLAMGASIFFYLAPVHPLKAVALSMLACAVTASAILAPALRLKIIGNKAL